MNKKIILVGLFVVSLFLTATSVACLSSIDYDPKNDVIYLEEYNFDFDLENLDYSDLEEIKNLDYTYDVNRPQIDIRRVVLSEVGSNTHFLVEVLTGQRYYPSVGSNGFIFAVILVDGDNIFVAASVKYELISISKYGFADIKDINADYIGNMSEDDYKDFHLSNDGTGKLSFDIPTDELPNRIDDIYVIIGEATISNVNIQEVTFTINDLYCDIFPNSLYGGSLNIPEIPEDTTDETEDTSDETENTSEDSEEEPINPFTVGLFIMLGAIVLISIPAAIFGKKT